MVRDKAVVAAVAVAVLLLGAGAFLMGGDGMAPRNQSDGGGNTSVTDSGNASFSFQVTRIESCGQTCRDVTAVLRNTGEEEATNVVVNVVIYTDGDQIWSDSFDVGTMGAGESVRSTQRVELGYGEALKIQGNDGWITIETVIRSSSGREVIRERQKVT